METSHKPLYIVGISCYYHDSAAALIKDGVVVAAAEEERFSRKKHDASFPIHAIQYLLEQEHITIQDVSHVAFYEKPFVKFERLMSQHLEMFPRSFRTFVSSTPKWLNEKLKVLHAVRRKLKFKGDVLFIEHHMAHAASAFLVSPFEKAAIVTVDGVGEWTTTTYGVGEGTDITLHKDIEFPHSLGLLYSTITGYLGMSVNNSEYKVMGMAPYGNMDRASNIYYHKLKRVIDVKDDGSYRLRMEYFVYHYGQKMPSKLLCELLGGPIRKESEPLTQRHKDIAAAVQLVLEDVMTKILNFVQQETKMENLVLAGGVALNSVYNGKILRNTKFKSVWIQPNATDGGGSVGAAAYAYFTLLGNKRVKPMQSAYLGPEYSDGEIKKFLDDNKIKYAVLKDDHELVKMSAKLIAENNVVGWFQGRMEWGPRALGARSILSNATNPEMKDILNRKVKHREPFRPFAPAVPEDDALTYFDCDSPIPEPADYMLMVYPIKEKYHKKIPAVTHVDGSGRLQTVRRFQNPNYYDMMKEVGKLTGVPIVINTSFNIRGEPIVCSPFDAYKCMMGTGIDVLVMGHFVIRRSENVRDAWDSEKYAKD